jgi:ribonuclease HI
MAVLPESNVAEGLALLKGMKFAKEMLLLNLKVEADSSDVITSINEAQPQQSYLGSIIEDCKSFVSSFPSIKFCHIRQEANQAARYLTKFAILECIDFVWVEETPPCISAVVAFDLLPPSV